MNLHMLIIKLQQLSTYDQSYFVISHPLQPSTSLFWSHSQSSCHFICKHFSMSFSILESLKKNIITTPKYFLSVIKYPEFTLPQFFLKIYFLVYLRIQSKFHILSDWYTQLWIHEFKHFMGIDPLFSVTDVLFHLWLVARYRFVPEFFWQDSSGLWYFLCFLI